MAHEDETSGLCVADADADVGRVASKGGQGVSGASFSSARMQHGNQQVAAHSSLAVVARRRTTQQPGSSKRIAGSDRRELISTADHAVELVVRLLLSYREQGVAVAFALIFCFYTGLSYPDIEDVKSKYNVTLCLADFEASFLLGWSPCES